MTMIGDGAGGAIVAWIENGSGTQDVYAQRLDANGNLLWPASGLPICRASGAQSNVVLAADAKFGALTGWDDFRAGNEDIYVNRAFAPGLLDVPVTASPGSRLALTSSNPMRGEARFRLELAARSVVSADVHDALGRRVRSLRSAAPLEPGAHVIEWDGRDDAGGSVATGLYFLRVRAGATPLAARVVRLR